MSKVRKICAKLSRFNTLDFEIRIASHNIMNYNPRNYLMGFLKSILLWPIMKVRCGSPLASSELIHAQNTSVVKLRAKINNCS